MIILITVITVIIVIIYLFFPDACTTLARAPIKLPSEDDKWLEFKNYCRKERVPFVVYADLECTMEKTDKDPRTQDLLPITKEKYISLTKHVDDTKDENDEKNICVTLRFIDSYRFLASSLDKLASFLNKDKLRVLRRKFSHLSQENFNLLTRKGVFPYEYIDCSEKLNESCLPPRESFYSSLTDDTVSESDYAHGVNVWQRFSIQTLGEYSDLYLKTDVFLLADVFDRDSCVASYGLDPAYYYTLPGSHGMPC
ncbi:hypothetical protein ALC62_05553 [Cyphomyrmex costatus]|uniref:DNA-directed DNA polymerase n=1 Tax=Cyphomyrmex costatus TaxID=456900 RepID=A0A151IJM2_9HYME|nr:hypothetical protein ALC62_05553 [Cyphomyrmex costatus]